MNEILENAVRQADAAEGGRVADVERGPVGLFQELHVAYLWQTSMRELLGLPADTRPVEIELSVRKLKARVEVLEGALEAINAIRDSIVGLQSFNFSEHAYPLVAALNAAGFEGKPYPDARENVGTLLERTNTAEARVAALERGLHQRDMDLAAEGALRMDVEERLNNIVLHDPLGELLARTRKSWKVVELDQGGEVES